MACHLKGHCCGGPCNQVLSVALTPPGNAHELLLLLPKALGAVPPPIRSPPLHRALQPGPAASTFLWALTTAKELATRHFLQVLPIAPTSMEACIGHSPAHPHQGSFTCTPPIMGHSPAHSYHASFTCTPLSWVIHLHTLRKETGSIQPKAVLMPKIPPQKNPKNK